MRRHVLSALTALSFAVAPASAFEISEMSPAEREAFRAEIRAYLLDNPEVIFEVDIRLVRDATDEEIEYGGKVEQSPDAGHA